MDFISKQGLIDEQKLRSNSENLLHVLEDHPIHIEFTQRIIVPHVVLLAPYLIQVDVVKGYTHGSLEVVIRRRHVFEHDLHEFSLLP